MQGGPGAAPLGGALPVPIAGAGKGRGALAQSAGTCAQVAGASKRADGTCEADGFAGKTAGRGAGAFGNGGPPAGRWERLHRERTKTNFHAAASAGAGTAIDGSGRCSGSGRTLGGRGTLPGLWGCASSPPGTAEQAAARGPGRTQTGAQSGGHAGKRAKNGSSSAGNSANRRRKIFPSPTKRSLPCAASSKHRHPQSARCWTSWASCGNCRRSING